MAVIAATELNRLLRGLSERQTGAATLPKHALVRDVVLLGPSSETFRGDFLELLPGVHRHGIRRPRHRVRGLAAP